jgi:hypothetical protein
MAADRPEVFNAYQQTQSPAAEKALMKAEIAASFIAEKQEKALFVVNQTRPLSSNIGLCTVTWLSQIASSPQNTEGFEGFGWPGVFGSR